MKFKTGDRVKNLVEDACIKKGATGTVMDDACVPYVKWDSIDMLIDKSNMAWPRNENYLELIELTPQQKFDAGWEVTFLNEKVVEMYAFKNDIIAIITNSGYKTFAFVINPNFTFTPPARTVYYSADFREVPETEAVYKVKLVEGARIEKV